MISRRQQLVRKIQIVESLIEEELEQQKAQRAQWIVNQYQKKWPAIGIAEFKTLDSLINKIAEVDPSRNGMYMPWIAKLIIADPKTNNPEDLSRVGTDLRNFENFKSRLEVKDINQYRSFSDLYSAIQPYVEAARKKADKPDKKQAALEKVRKDIITVYSGPEGWVRIPTTEAASRYLGQGTAWCTAYTDRKTHFEQYDKTDRLFVVYDKNLANKYRSWAEGKTPSEISSAVKRGNAPSDGRFQLHLSNKEFATTGNRNIGLDSMPEWAKKPIIDWYRANVKLTPSQLIKLQRWTDEDISVGTGLEDLMDLIKTYRPKI